MNRKKRSRSACDERCPCGSQCPYADCCGPFLEGAAQPPDAAALMRSRYTAYVIGRCGYLLASWHASTRPLQSDLDLAPSARWLGLEIRRHVATGPATAIVEFLARYRLAGRAGCQHEVSRFVREDGRWYYVDGDFPAVGE
jgi:SEC-C motif-containing protein